MEVNILGWQWFWPNSLVLQSQPLLCCEQTILEMVLTWDKLTQGQVLGVNNTISKPPRLELMGMKHVTQLSDATFLGQPHFMDIQLAVKVLLKKS